jgi:hypothetical protein
MIALLSAAGDLDAASSVIAVLHGGKRIPLQVRRGSDRRGIMRKGRDLAWSGAFELPDGGKGSVDLTAQEDASGVTYSSKVTAETPLEVDAIQFVLDLPRTIFVNGHVKPAGGQAVPLALERPANPASYRGDSPALRFESPDGKIVLNIAFGGPRSAAVIDRWDEKGRSFQLRATLQDGPLAAGASASLDASLRLTNNSVSAPVRLHVDTSAPRYHFDGFGGNYCWNNQSPVSAYTLQNLKLAWARTEMKIVQWDKQRDNPGPEIRADFETMRQFQKLGVPYVISIWWLPERFYTDPYEKPRMAHFRLINPEKWDELLELLGSYLTYARREYGAEPDLFSFNEANLGVYVGLTPVTHTAAIKRIGAYFQKLGLKTRMLLGDATGPRDTHTFVLEAAADPEAMQFVGAVGFHSWGGGTPEQYTAWGDVGEWLHLPLLVTELGVDAAAYYTRSWDSYHYGLREARMTQELLTYARPQGTQFWQFTNDYALARVDADGKVQPTARFWLMKHFTDLTPHQSDALRVSSDQGNVLFTAFRKGNAYTLHILNLGGLRDAIGEGLPDAAWRVVQTTEATPFENKAAAHTSAGTVRLVLPSRSLVTLTGDVAASAAATP